MFKRLIKYSFLYLLLLASGNAFSQNYFDSLATYISPLPTQQKVEAINNIPFDKMNSNTSAAIKMYEEVIVLAEAKKDTEQLAIINEKIATAYYYKGDYDLSVDAALVSIHLYEELANNLKVGSAYANLGYQMKRRNLAKAFEYMQMGIGFLEQINDQPALSAAYNNFGVLHEMDGDIDSALFYYQKGLVIVNEINDSIGIPYSLNNIAGAYVLQKKYKEAIPFYNSAFTIREKRNDLNGLAENYTYYGDFYFKQNQFNEAILNYKKGRELSAEINYNYLQRVNADQLSICYEKLGLFDKALKYQKEATVLKDSLLNESTNNTIAQLETQFQTIQKEKTIAEQKVSLAEKELIVKKRNYSLMGAGLLVMFLLFLGYFIYKQQRQKQLQLIAENQLKDQIAQVKIQNELHEERLRISRDLHDNIGSQLTFIISSVDNMRHLFKSADEKLNNKLSDVSTFTRTTITQLRDTIWALNKDEISFEDLKLRLYNYIENANLAQEQTTFEFSSDLKSDIQLNSIQGVSIYRVVQEAINNAMKYSAATSVQLNISEKEKEIILSIKDDGIGFNLAEIQLGNGLENMKNRSAAINAQFEINSKPQKGTKITLRLDKNKLNKG